MELNYKTIKIRKIPTQQQRSKNIYNQTLAKIITNRQQNKTPKHSQQTLTHTTQLNKKTTKKFIKN